MKKFYNLGASYFVAISSHLKTVFEIEILKICLQGIVCLC